MKTNKTRTPVLHLRTYVDDHLAGIVGEIQLAERIARNNGNRPVAAFLEGYQVTVRHEKELLERVARSIGAKPSSAKQGVAWLTEKLGRLKLNNAWVRYSDLSRVEELEVLIAAATFRRSLWDTLSRLNDIDSCLTAAVARDLRARSEQQLQSLTVHVREAAAVAFQRDTEQPVADTARTS